MSEEKKKFSVSEIIDSLGITKFTWMVFLFLGFAMIFDGYDFMIVNVTNVNVATSFGIDPKGPVMGSLTTWSLIGMVIGGAFGGILSDKFGRKKTLICAIAFYSIFTLPQAFAQDYAFFAAFRLIAGLGVGSCIPVVTTPFSETKPSKHRGVFITFGMAFMVLGWVLAGIIGNPITNADHAILPALTETITNAEGVTSFGNWRITYLIGAIPFIYAILLFFFMKESPHWFANSGRKKEAIERLNELEFQAKGTSTYLEESLLVVPPKPEKTNPSVLFSKKYIIATLAIWTTYFIGQFCVYGMNAWLPTWFKGIGYSPADAVMLQTFNNIAAIVSNVTVGFVSDRIGRKKNLAFAWLFAIVAIILCSLFVVPNSFVLCVGLMLLFGFALNYAITAVQPIMPESYPTQIRNTGVSWAQAFARFGGAIAPIILGSLATSTM